MFKFHSLIFVCLLLCACTEPEIAFDCECKDFYNGWKSGRSGPFNNNASPPRAIDLDRASFQILKACCYAKDKFHAYYQGGQLQVADAGSFEAIEGPYARDKDHAYFMYHIIEGADPSTFQVLDEPYAKDKNFYYYRTVRIDSSKGREFKKLTYDYCVVGQDVYFEAKPLHVKDASKFRFLSGTYSTDSNTVYYKGLALKDADPGSFMVFGRTEGLFGKDRNWAYYQNYKLNYNRAGKKIIDTIDVATLEIINTENCKDKFGKIPVLSGRY